MAQCAVALCLLLVLSVCLAHEELCPERDSSCFEDPEVLLQVGVSRFVGVKASKQEKKVSVVALTYCDAHFAPIWPVFVKCYERAFGCPGNEASCGNSMPQLLDLGLESDNYPGIEKLGSHCTQQKPSLLSVTPSNVPLVILDGMVKQLTLGNDVLRLDADAFFLRDPMPALQKEFPDADVIGSPDCGSGPGQYCAWYLDVVYNTTHGGRDPLSEVGFMLNTGIMYMRSNHRTISLAKNAQLAVQSGRSTYEQVALNEEFVKRHCDWTTSDLEPLRGRWAARVKLQNQGKTLLGRCDDGLKVVVLPYRRFQRQVPKSKDHIDDAIAVHPGGFLDHKMKLLPSISKLC